MRILLASSSCFLAALAFAACSDAPPATTGSSSSTSGAASSSSTSTSSGAGGSGSSSSASSTSSSTGSSSSSSGTGGQDPGTTTLTATMGPITIQSGDEAVKCITVSLHNPQGAFVRKFKTTLHPGSHHMIVYKSTQPENLTPVPCMSFGVLGGSAIFIAEQTHSELDFPKDPNGTPVGLELSPNQTVTIEMHYINTTNGPLDIQGSVDLDVIPLGANVIQSGLLFQGAFSIPTIPAHGEADTGVLFQSVPKGTKVFALTTHQHHLGTEMQVWFSKSPGDTSTRVADGLSWSDPPLELFSPTLDFTTDNMGFSYDCHWKNPGSTDVHGGLSANDEMCFFWSYFYNAP